MFFMRPALACEISRGVSQPPYKGWKRKTPMRSRTPTPSYPPRGKERNPPMSSLFTKLFDRVQKACPRAARPAACRRARPELEALEGRANPSSLAGHHTAVLSAPEVHLARHHVPHHSGPHHAPRPHHPLHFVPLPAPPSAP